MSGVVGALCISAGPIFVLVLSNHILALDHSAASGRGGWVRKEGSMLLFLGQLALHPGGLGLEHGLCQSVPVHSPGKQSRFLCLSSPTSVPGSRTFLTHHICGMCGAKASVTTWGTRLLPLVDLSVPGQ